jgi:hypothetical protein
MFTILTVPSHFLIPAGPLSLYRTMAGLGRSFGYLLKNALNGAAIPLPHLVTVCPLKVAFTVFSPALVAHGHSYIVASIEAAEEVSIFQRTHHSRKLHLLCDNPFLYKSIVRSITLCI